MAMYRKMWREKEKQSIFVIVNNVVKNRIFIRIKQNVLCFVLKRIVAAKKEIPRIGKVSTSNLVPMR